MKKLDKITISLVFILLITIFVNFASRNTKIIFSENMNKVSSIQYIQKNDLSFNNYFIDNKYNIDKSLNQVHNNKVNINTADKQELMNLPNIGETIACYIIEYRNNIGYFKSIDEIKNVKRIGDKTYNLIKDLIEI